MIEVLGRQIANKMNEITIEEFEKISNIHNNSELDNIEKQIKVFEVVGIEEDEWDIAALLPVEQFEKATKNKVWADSRKKF